MNFERASPKEGTAYAQEYFANKESDQGDLEARGNPLRGWTPAKIRRADTNRLKDGQSGRERRQASIVTLDFGEVKENPHWSGRGNGSGHDQGSVTNKNKEDQGGRGDKRTRARSQMGSPISNVSNRLKGGLKEMREKMFISEERTRTKKGSDARS